MKQYHDMLRYVMQNGVDRQDRTGTGTRSVFGYQTRYDLSQGFPLLTTKKVYMKGVIHELLWFLKGDTNIRYLVCNGVNIWNEWAYQVYLEKNNLVEKFPRYSPEWNERLAWFVETIRSDETFAEQWGNLGPVYGKQWRQWQGPDGAVDQIANVIELIKNDPNSRRMVVSGWNIGEIESLVKNKHSAPPPCHTLFQFVVIEGKLCCQLYQRSADLFLGVPFNIASYALLTCLIAQVTGLRPGDFVHTFGDLHLYKNHFDQVHEQLTREERPLPTLRLNPSVKDINSFTYDDIILEGYNPHPPIKAPISV